MPDLRFSNGRTGKTIKNNYNPVLKLYGMIGWQQSHSAQQEQTQISASAGERPMAAPVQAGKQLGRRRHGDLTGA